MLRYGICIALTLGLGGCVRRPSEAADVKADAPGANPVAVAG